MTKLAFEPTVTEVELKPRTEEIGVWVNQCARGEIPFSGPESLCARVSARGFNINGLYEMVRAAEMNVRVERLDQSTLIGPPSDFA